MSRGETFIFAGPEIGERNDAIAKSRAALTEKYSSPLEEHSFYVGETTTGEIISLLLNASLFCDARLVFVKSAELIKKKDDVESFISYIKAPADDTTLIFITDENGIDKKIEDAAISFGAHYKHIFWEMFEERKESWIRNYFKREGFSITDDGIAAILEMVENNTDALRRECSAITLFFLNKNKKTLDAEDIESVLSAARSVSAFSLFQAICTGDFTKSLSLMHALLDAGENTYMIFSAIISSFKRFRDFCVLSAAGKGSNDFELRKVGITSLKAKSDYRAGAKFFGLDKADELIALCVKSDLQLRQTDSSYQCILMDMFLHNIFKLKRE
ncbi:MAG: DNA polymerase III subunit delta [Termitinemataceae bacterium]|nr:MAG: DNA polymerase III subunit delta [Termitinemataceae bacterium]